MNTTVKIELPADLHAFAEEQTAKGGHASLDGYVQSLLEEEQKRQASQRLEAMLLAGLDSGPATPVTAEFWAKLRCRGETGVPEVKP